VCAIDHEVTEGEPVDEQYCEQEPEDQCREPEPEGQYLDQDLPEGLVNGKSNPILDAYLSQFYKCNLLVCFIKCIILLQDMVG
jgi:hypothetical protein